MGCAAAPPADDASAHAGPASPAATAIAGTPDPRSRSPERSPWFGHPRPRLLSLAARDSFFFPRTLSFPQEPSSVDPRPSKKHKPLTPVSSDIPGAPSSSSDLKGSRSSSLSPSHEEASAADVLLALS